ncbi:hypothetical protein [Advenella sp. FME57]|uniref:hypothetical protein n=1 Tax=Advenella sp. FME57 TaxID=2742604 RepID=UPI0018685CC6|nr:hypothetical protein [Advenella sp. FME57]
MTENIMKKLSASKKYSPNAPFLVEKQAEMDGVQMGVLENGLPFLTERGLARMCGIDRKVLNKLSIAWADEQRKPRGKKINQLLDEIGYTEATLHLGAEYQGRKINVYTEPVCFAILEYYAFITNRPRLQAINAFRSMARITFRKFIYDSVGYKPEQRILEQWKHFHDRLDLTQNTVPDGYWGVFKEIAIMIIPLINAGVIISDKVLPDISVGRAWSEYWTKNDLEFKFGKRIKYRHEYPDYYPQAKSNPQPSYAYPNDALGKFRNWLQNNYILNKFPTYLLGQASKGSVTSNVVRQTIEAFGKKSIPRQKLLENQHKKTTK